MRAGQIARLGAFHLNGKGHDLVRVTKKDVANDFDVAGLQTSAQHGAKSIASEATRSHRFSPYCADCLALCDCPKLARPQVHPLGG